MREWIESGWPIHVLAFAALATAAAVADLFLRAEGLRSSSKTSWAEDVVSWTFLLEVIVLYVLLRTLVNAYRSRNRLVIRAAANFAGSDFAEFASGVSVEIANGLMELYRLTKTVDDVNPVSKGGEVPPRIALEDSTERLADIVGEKSELKVGPLNFPLRPFAAALQRMFAGQNLSTSLHRDGNCLLIHAVFSGGGGPWTVRREISGSDSWGIAPSTRGKSLAEMKEELVYRIFSELEATGSKEWVAVWHLIEGLRAYRHTLVTEEEKEIYLAKAEDHFVQSRRCDIRFGRGTYNLAIVYRDQGMLERAQAAFRLALKEGPRNADAAYALGVLEYSVGNFSSAVELSDRAIEHAPEDPRAWNLRGRAYRLAQEQPDGRDAWELTLPYRRQAVALAWRDLCRSVWQRQSPNTALTAVAATCQNLAVAQLTIGKFEKGISILRQAIRRNPTADLYFELGKALRESAVKRRERSPAAVTAYWSAIRLADTPKQAALFHAHLAEMLLLNAAFERAALEKGVKPATEAESERPGEVDQRSSAEQNHEAAALRSVRAALAMPSILDESILNQLRDVCSILTTPDLVASVERIKEIQAAAAKQRDETTSQLVTRIESLLNRPEPQSQPDSPAHVAEMTAVDEWCRAKLEIFLGQLDPEETGFTLERREALLRRALERLAHHAPHDSLVTSATLSLSQIMRDQSEGLQAVAFAEQALSLDPFSTDVLTEMGELYVMFRDFKKAEKFYQRSLALAPSNAYTLSLYAFTIWMRNAALSDAQERKKAVRNVIDLLLKVAQLRVDHATLARTYFWLARFNAESLDFDEAVAQFDTAFAHANAVSDMAMWRIESRFYMAAAQVDMEIFNGARQSLGETAFELFRAKQEEKPASRKSWWCTPRLFSDRRVPPIFFLLCTFVMQALVLVQQGKDFKGAKRHLGYFARLRALLPESAVFKTREERTAYRTFVWQLDASYRDVLGLVTFLEEGAFDAAIRYFQESIRLEENSDALYHLAQVYLAQGNYVLVTSTCDRARRVDIRGVFSARLDKLETEARKATATDV